MNNNSVLQAYTWIRSALITVLLCVLFLLSLFPVTVLPYDIINSATRQVARVQAISKDVLVLEIAPVNASGPYANAVSELQGILPLFRAEEAYLQSIQKDNIRLEMTQVNSDYSPIINALNAITGHIDKPADPIQVGIVLGHEHDFTLEMNQVIAIMLQDLDAIDQSIFNLSTTMLAIIFGLTVINVVIMLRHSRDAERRHMALITPVQVNPVTTARNEEV